MLGKAQFFFLSKGGKWWIYTPLFCIWVPSRGKGLKQSALLCRGQARTELNTVSVSPFQVHVFL